MAEPQIQAKAETQFIEQKISQRVTITAGTSQAVSVAIPAQAKAYLKGYGYSFFTSSTYQLSVGTLKFPSRTDQEGSPSIPVIYGNPYPVTSGNIELYITNGDSADHTYDVVFYVLCNRIIPISSTGGELILATGSGGTSGAVTIYDSSVSTAANVTAKGLQVDPQAPATLLAGTKTAGSAAAALASSTSCKKVTIQIGTDGGSVYVGNATSQPILLVPTQTMDIEIDDLAKVYVKRATVDTTVSYVGS